MIRAPTERLWLDEALTKRVLSERKKHAANKAINEIQYRSKITQESKEITLAFVEFYTELLGLKIDDPNRFRVDFLSLMPRLEHTVRESLKSEIAVAEIEAAIDGIMQMQVIRAGWIGCSHIQVSFKTEMAMALHRVIAECYEKKQAPLSFRTAHVVLIPKTDDPAKLLSVESYRPIRLMSTDYKINMEVLARLIQSVIQSLVGPHQTCGIKGRTILLNIHIARSILECCDAMHDRVAIIQLD